MAAFQETCLVHAVRHGHELTYQETIELFKQRHPDQFQFIPFISREDTAFAITGRVPAAIQDGRLEARAGIANLVRTFARDDCRQSRHGERYALRVGAALSSCHMLTFLALASNKGFVVDRYDDTAVGHLEKNADGTLAVTRVELHPKIVYSGAKQPTQADLDWLHDKAHRGCFIANSVTTEVRVVAA